MSPATRPAPRPHLPPPETPEPRRAPWRQRLVDVERGLALGFRGDSSFFVYGFVSTACVAAGFILKIGLVGWAILALAVAVVVSVEMLNQMLKTVVDALPGPDPRLVRKAKRLGTAATFVAIAGAGTTVLLILGRRLVDLLAPG